MKAIEVKKVIKHCGSQVLFAKKLGITQGAVAQWVKRGKIPDSRILEVWRICNKKYSLHRLAPHLYPKSS